MTIQLLWFFMGNKVKEKYEKETNVLCVRVNCYLDKRVRMSYSKSCLRELKHDDRLKQSKTAF